MSQELMFQHHVFCCINRRADDHKRGSCAARGAEKLQSYMKSRAKELGIKQTRINKSQCLDQCELGPVMVVYPDAVWYQYQTTEDIDEILQSHLIEGKPVKRLQLSVDQLKALHGND